MFAPRERDFPRMIVGDIPPSLNRDAVRLAVGDERVIFSIFSDLTVDGRPHDVWLLVTERRAVVFERDPRGETAVRGPHAFEGVEDVRTFQTVGSAFLQFKIRGLYIDIVRYSNARRDEFNRVAAQLLGMLKGEDLDLGALSRPSDSICPDCGLPLTTRGSACPRCTAKQGVFWRSVGLMSPYRGFLFLLLGLMILGVGLDLVPPRLQKLLVDRVLVPRENMDWLPWILLVMLGVATVRGIFGILTGYVSAHVGTRITRELRERLQRKLLQLGVDYYDRHSAGNLMSRVLYDVDFFQQFVAQVAQGFLLNVILVLGIGIILFTMQPLLATLILLPIPLVVVGTMLFWRYILTQQRRTQDSRARMSRSLVGLLSGIRLVKAFGQSRHEEQRFSQSAAYMQQSQRSLQISYRFYNPIMAYVFGFGGLIVWYSGGRQVLGGNLTLGTLMAFFAYLAMFYGPITMMTQFTEWLTGFVAAGQRVFEILDAVPSLSDPDDPRPLPELRGGIELRNVTFGYDPYNPVLKNVSMKIEPGQSVGIVGKSGSGKTTLINLICRFYDVQRGEVLIDGVNVKDIAQDDLRRHIALVLQDPFLFRSTIAANIAYGRPEADERGIIDAARAANAHDFIAKRPIAYDTMLGDGGSGLSGGERQRVSIARALLCRPRVLILDEATSSVDTESEMEIQKALNVLGKERTTIAVAHRLSTLKNADVIYVIDNGKIAENGSHEELMEHNGIYAKLVRIQTELTRLELD